MMPYASRIPVDQSYVQAIGQVMYNFATVEWNIVYLGSLIAPSFVSRESGADFDIVVREFGLLSETGKHPEYAYIAVRFAEMAKRRQDLLKSIPFTASGGAQELGGAQGPDDQWTEEKVQALAKDLEDLDIEANDLYYKLSSPAH